MDYKIIQSLKDDSRKAISDVATEVGASAKTIRNRLTRMMKNNLIELTLEWFPDKSNDIITLIDVHLKAGVNLSIVPYHILQKYIPNGLFYWCYVNIPSVITFVIWTNSMTELQNLQEKFEQEDAIEYITPNILYIGYIFETWRDKLLKSQ